MKKVLLFGLLSMFYASNVIGLEAINDDVLGIVVTKIDPQFCSGNLTGSVAAILLESLFPLMQRYKPTKDVCNLMLTNKKMLDNIKKVIKIKDENREKFLNFFGESGRKNLRKFYDEQNLTLFTALYDFQFNQAKIECLFYLELIKKSISFELHLNMNITDPDINIRDYPVFYKGWCDRNNLTDHLQLCFERENSENKKALITQWIAFFNNKIIPNESIVPEGNGYLINTLVTMINLDERLPLTAELFLLFSNLKNLEDKK